MKEAIKLAIEGGWRIRGKVAEYALRSKGKWYLISIDTTDLPIVGGHGWYLTNGYAVTSIKGKRVKMHHLIAGKPPAGKEVDHFNRDRLDNCRGNLRFVSSLVNGQNTTAVGVRKHGKKWEANVCLNYKKIHKSFNTKNEALAWRKKIKSDYLKTL